MQVGQTWATLVRDVWFFIYWTSGVQPRGEPGRSVCPVKEPRRETSAKKAFSKAEIASGKAEIAFGKQR